MRAVMSITKALADENRVRTLLALREGELCVCQITELFGLAPSGTTNIELEPRTRTRNQERGTWNDRSRSLTSYRQSLREDFG